MRRASSWIVMLTMVAVLAGCGVGGGIEPGMPSDLDMSKIPDPMAGVKTQAPARAKLSKKVDR